MFLVVYSILVLWALIFLINHLFQLQRRRSALPTNVPPRLSNTPTYVVLKPFHLVIDTTIFNPVLDTFSAHLYDSPIYQIILRRFYDIGNLFGVLGMFAIICLLTWTTVKLSYLLLQVPANPPYAGLPLAKRDLVAITSENSELPIHLIIPGLTAPFSHLPILLIALFIGQTIHELGHAISAAVESVPLSSAGASLFVIVPSAFVSLSSGTLQRLSPQRRLRIISGGAFHNLFAWALILVLGWTGVGSAFLSIGYEDVSHQGRVVVSVDHDSPLRLHLPVGVVITKLNDFSLTLPDQTDVWSQYFLEHDTVQDPDSGWCVEEEWFSNQNSSCCLSQTPNDYTESCFAASGGTTTDRCIDPVPLLTDIDDSKRCSVVHPCNSTSVCVRPTTNEHLLRIRHGSAGMEKVVLWSGPALEVWEQVEVGCLFPRTFLNPIWLPRLLEVYFMYLKTIMISLYLVNLLPLQFLDGDQVLAITAELMFKEGNGSQELDIAERGFRSWSVRSEGRIQRRRYLFKAGVQTTAWTVVISSILLTALHW